MTTTYMDPPPPNMQTRSISYAAPGAQTFYPPPPPSIRPHTSPANHSQPPPYPTAPMHFAPPGPSPYDATPFIASPNQHYIPGAYPSPQQGGLAPPEMHRSGHRRTASHGSDRSVKSHKSHHSDKSYHSHHSHHSHHSQGHHGQHHHHKDPYKTHRGDDGTERPSLGDSMVWAYSGVKTLLSGKRK